MQIFETKFKDVYIIENFHAADERGSFVKTFNENFFKESGLQTDFKEGYYSISKRNVVRGMHFQVPPYDHAKLVYVPVGKILDVVLDLRTKSKTYGECIGIELNQENKRAIYIPNGCAHGFLSLEDNTYVFYNVTSVYNKVADCGIHWRTIPFAWNIASPIVSARDESFVSFHDFISPFK